MTTPDPAEKYHPPDVAEWISKHPKAKPPYPLPKQSASIHKRAAECVREIWSASDIRWVDRYLGRLEQIHYQVAEAFKKTPAPVLVWYHPDTDTFWHYPV
ncbi:MAG TPA: hypothetical protein VF585_02310 [Chthoniobacterales bacterium]|jgi:hypothetical protein